MGSGKWEVVGWRVVEWRVASSEWETKEESGRMNEKSDLAVSARRCAELLVRPRGLRPRLRVCRAPDLQPQPLPPATPTPPPPTHTPHTAQSDHTLATDIHQCNVAIYRHLQQTLSIATLAIIEPN